MHLGKCQLPIEHKFDTIFINWHDIICLMFIIWILKLMGFVYVALINQQEFACCHYKIFVIKKKVMKKYLQNSLLPIELYVKSDMGSSSMYKVELIILVDLQYQCNSKYNVG
jgi:hypothetical protein